MYSGNLTDVYGITAAHCTDEAARTGCTVVLAKEGAIGSVDVRGGGPGTRETDAFSPINLVQQVHGVALSGGSAFGLATADGVMQYLDEQNIGFDTGVAKVPIVGGAVLFDLAYSESGKRPTAKMGYQAAKSADKTPLVQGSYGAGAGATVAKMLPGLAPKKSGFGTASMKVGKATIAAGFAVNALGNIYDYATGQLICGYTLNEQTKAMKQMWKAQNTTIGVIATDAVLTKTQAHRLAMLAHDGYAMAIRPVHTMHDGDTAFALATGHVEENVDLLFAFAAEVTARAIANAVWAANA
ncbi:MAG: P1 family peptidase [Acutalibacteraceae bacterium]